MSETGFWIRFVLAALATWRVTHLLAREDGPADVIAHLRRRAGRGMECAYCLSFWVAAPLAFSVSSRPLDLLLTWLALSGVACLIERAGEQPIVIQPIQEGDSHAMLRPDANRDQHSFSGRA